MGLTRVRFPVLLILAFGFVKLVSAAPMLRLVATTVGPISVAAGNSPAPQKVEAYNAGDGSLALTLKSSVPWITPTAGAPGACSTTSASKTCIPLTFAFNTSSLPASSKPVAGIVTVSGDSTTVDAPQTIVVTVQVGGGVPSSVDVYVAPGSSSDTVFYTNSQINGQASTQDGNKWLTLTAGGVGSFQFVIPYSVHVAPKSGNLAGSTYTGSLVTTGSSFAADNKTIPVTMRVTSQPIAQPTSSQLSVSLAQGAAPLAPPFSPSVGLINVGQGTLVAQPATISGSGMSASSGALTFDPTGLSAGDYTGSVTLASNAVNGTITVPVDFQVVAKGAPQINYQGVQDNATFVPGDTVAPGDVMVVKGQQLSLSAFTPASAVPLSTQLADTSVLVNGVAAPLYYTSYGQIAFQLPFSTAAGAAVVQVQRNDGTPISNKVSVNVAARAPKLLLIGVGSYGAIENQDYSLPLPTSGTYGSFSTHPAKIGDVLTIYAIGLGSTTPTVTSGTAAPAAPPYAPLNVNPIVNFGGGIAGIMAQPSYAGLSGGGVGLYQVNVTIPPGTPKGTVNLSLVFPDSVSNSVQIAVE